MLTVPSTPSVGDGVAASWGATVAGDVSFLDGSAVTRVQATSFTTVVTSTGATEAVGCSQAVALTTGRRYRVTVAARTWAGTANNRGVIRVRYSTAALSTSSTQAGSDHTTTHSGAGGTQADTVFFFKEFVAPSTATYNIGLGCLTSTGTGNENIDGTAPYNTEVTVDDVGT